MSAGEREARTSGMRLAVDAVGVRVSEPSVVDSEKDTREAEELSCDMIVASEVLGCGERRGANERAICQTEERGRSLYTPQATDLL